MALRRLLLVILGALGSVLAATMLYISVNGMGLPEENIATVPDLAEGTKSLSLPVIVPGTTLLAQEILPYEGPFLEDGTDTEVIDVAALQVYNTGSNEVRKAHISIQWGGILLEFYGENIPAGSTVLLLERNAQSYRTGSLLGCVGWQSESRELSFFNQIAISDQALGTLVVTNLTDSAIKNVCIYYKSWLSPPDIYIGGITYSIEIPVLLPGQTQYLYPNHYAKGYSKVVSVVAQAAPLPDGALKP